MTPQNAHRCILRYTLGVTFAAGVAFLYQWPLFFIAPVFAALFLSLPLPSPDLRAALALIGDFFTAFTVNLAFTLLLTPYPLVFCAALAPVLFHIYYRLGRGGGFIWAVVSLMAVTLLPLLGLEHEALASGVAVYFGLSAALGVAVHLGAHIFVPDPPSTPGAAQPFRPEYDVRAVRAALRSTCAVWPMAVLFLAAGWTDQALVLVYAAIFSITASADRGRRLGVKSMTSTLIGGAAAVAFVLALKAAPGWHIFVPLMALAALLMGRAIFSERPVAPYMGSAMTALLILVATTLGPDGNVLSEFAERVAMIGCATAWIVGVMAILECAAPEKSQNQAISAP